MQIAINDTDEENADIFFEKAFDFIDSAFGEAFQDDANETGFKKTYPSYMKAIDVITNWDNEFETNWKMQKVFKANYPMSNNNRVLIHCSLGVSRSVTFAIMFIMKKFSIPYEEVEE